MNKPLKKSFKKKTVARAKRPRLALKRAADAMDGIKASVEDAVHSVEKAAMKMVEGVKHVFTSEK